MNPSHEMGSILSCLICWATHRHLNNLRGLPHKVHPPSPTFSPPENHTFLQCREYHQNHGDVGHSSNATALQSSWEGPVKHTLPHHQTRLLTESLRMGTQKTIMLTRISKSVLFKLQCVSESPEHLIKVLSQTQEVFGGA